VPVVSADVREPLRRIALLIRIDGGRSGGLEVADVDTSRAVRVDGLALVLTLETEPEATVSRGHLRSLVDEAVYPIQTNRALFNALASYVAAEDHRT